MHFLILRVIFKLFCLAKNKEVNLCSRKLFRSLKSFATISFQNFTREMSCLAEIDFTEINYTWHIAPNHSIGWNKDLKRS